MHSRVLTIALAVGLVLCLLALGPTLGTLRLPGNQQGYEPAQPVAYSHRLHAGELQMDCRYCHSGSDVSRHAGIPAAQVCMNCHRFVTAPWGAVKAEAEQAQSEGREPRRVVSPELQKLYDALGLGEDMQPAAGAKPRPIAWTRVHRLPDFVAFDHRAHAAGEVPCETCHGPVATMERMRQVSDLSMGWCISCHRQPGRFVVASRQLEPSLDCSACHY